MTETEARAIAAPGSWPWPMSQGAQRWVDDIVRIYNDPVQKSGVGKPIGEQFNRAEHDKFMRSL